MPEYLAPGVYVEEIDTGVRSIEGVPTSTAGFVGATERGPLSASLVTCETEYRRRFGALAGPDAHLPYAVRGFFANGGRRLVICRVVGAGATTASLTLGALTLRALGPGTWGDRIAVRVEPAGDRWRLRVAYWRDVPPGFVPDAGVTPPAIEEDFTDLPLAPHALETVSRESALVTLDGAVAEGMASDGWRWLEGGNDGAPSSADDFAGEPSTTRATPQGLAALAAPDAPDVALLYAPCAPALALDVARLLIAHGTQHRRFALLDGPPDTNVEAARAALGDAPCAALYWPWLVVAALDKARARVTVPPGGHVAGVYARVDTERGVHQAPANEVLRDVRRLASGISRARLGALNRDGINTIRRVRARGIRLWGARTLALDPEWRYVPVRRLLIYLERSIDRGLQWAVFEPNDERLWTRVLDTLRQFLAAQWRSGAFAGANESEAFFVRCDRSTMTQDDIDNGRLVCLIGVAPVKPAEFVIFRIGQWTACRRCD